MTNDKDRAGEQGAPERLQTARTLHSSGRLREALECLRGSSEFDVSLCELRAEIEFSLGNFQDSALSYSAVAIAGGDDPNADFNTALALERCGRWDLALDAFDRALRRDPDLMHARVGMGACLLHLNRSAEALAIFNECVEGLEPGPALMGKAVALQRLGRTEEAEELYGVLLRSNPDSGEILSNLIAMSAERRDLDRMLDYSLRLLEIQPQSIAALKGLAAVALQEGDSASAASYCDRILELEPDCLEAWHNLRVAMELTSFRNEGPGTDKKGEQ